ncbi:MAG TPA: hypothetical protein PK970_01635 [Hyphomicrobiaceae bacterium]|nr:hypothetical protein [Hyphomicrobiaceae bacterium]
MRRLWQFIVVSLLASGGAAFLWSESGRAARMADRYFPAPSRYEILVFEKAGCRYCEVFRADVATRYKDLPQASKMPMRFLDVEKVDIGALGLRDGLTLVPTAVVMRDGAEVDRIQGLTSAQNFLLLLQHIAGPLD